MTFPFSAAQFGLGAKSTWSIGISTEGFYLSGFCRQVSGGRRATDTGCVKALGWCVAIKSLLTFLPAMQSAGSATKWTVCSSAVSVINIMKVLKKWGESHRQYSAHSAACINRTKMKCPIWNWWHLLHPSPTVVSESFEGLYFLYDLLENQDIIFNCWYSQINLYIWHFTRCH